jgi:hypothetical protein
VNVTVYSSPDPHGYLWLLGHLQYQLIQSGCGVHDAMELPYAFEKAVASRLVARQQELLRQRGYDLDCVCGWCAACAMQECIRAISPEAT